MRNSHCLKWLIAVLSAMASISVARADYQSTVLSDDPLGYWPLNLSEDTQTGPGGSYIANDYSGNGNSGTYYNITPGSLVAGPTAYVTNAIVFSSAEVDLSTGTNTPILNFTGPTTLEAWAQPADSTTFGDIIGKGYDSANYQEIALREDGIYGANYFGYFGSGGLSGGQQTPGQWVYLVLSNDGTNDYLYINGQLVGKAGDTTGSIAFANTNTWAIGNGTSGGDGRLFNGNLCQVAIYNHGLTAAQVLKHFYAAELNASPSVSPPIIITQPQPQSSYPGGTARFSVAAVSGLPTTNQWYKNGVAIPGQTNTTLTVSDANSGTVANYSVVVGNSNGTTNSAMVAFTLLAVGNSLEWSPYANTGTWDVGSSANWTNVSAQTQTVFNNGDEVLFDDTPGVPTTVNVSGTVEPALITVNSSTNDFTITSGTIAGSGSLVKEGTSTLTVDSAGGFDGNATIEGGVLYAGNNSFDSVYSITVTNNSTFDMGGASMNNDNLVTISGQGFNGKGALYNSYSDDPDQLLNITLSGPALIGASQRWDLASGSEISGPYGLTVDWSGGAGYGQWNGVTIGADVPQITLTNSGTLGMTAMDTSCLNPATVFNISTNDQLVLYSGGFNGSVTLYNGAQLIVYSANVNLGGSTLHVYPGATMSLYAQGIAMTGNNLIFENGATLQTFYNGGNNPIANQVTLNGVAHFILGDHSESFSNVVSGVGGFVLDYYNEDAVFSAANTYSGPTIIGSSGNSPVVALTGNGSISHSSLIFFGGDNPTVSHIDVSGRSDQTLTLASGQTLEGVGGINGSLVVSSGAILSPGGTNTTIGITTGSNPVGTVAASDNVTLNGTTVIKLNGTTNDIVEAAANITYGGTLNLVNITGSPLAGGSSFQIFNAASYSGTFTSITPATPGPGQTWNTSQLSSGIISVVGNAGGPVIGGTSISGGNFIFSGTGGSDNGTYYVLTSTNLTTPLSQWTTIATNTFSGTGGFSVTNALSGPVRFYIIK